MSKPRTVTDRKRTSRRPLVLGSASKEEAQLERMIVSRLNALTRLWGGHTTRSENSFNLLCASKHVELSYATYSLDGEILYDLTIRDTLADHRIAHVEYVFNQGNEVVPLPDHSSVVFSSNKNQATVFADSINEFCRQVTSAARAYTEALEHAKRLLPRGA